MTGTEKWYDRVRDHTLTRIEETLTTLKTLRASEADAQTREELEEILTQQIDTISDHANPCSGTQPQHDQPPEPPHWHRHRKPAENVHLPLHGRHRKVIQ